MLIFNTSGKPAKLVFYALLMAGMGWFSGCESREIIYDGPHYVRFTREDTTARESVAGTFRLSVHNAGPQLSTPVTVTYLTGGKAREGIDYRFVSNKGTVVIPANQSFGYIELQLINNANNILESQDIVFTITGVSPANLRIGLGAAEIGKIMRFTIQDECLLNGTYSGVNLDARQQQTYQGITITSTDCREYTLSNWNFSFFGFNAIKADLTFIDHGDNSLTIPKQIESELSAPRDTISGDGFINPIDQTITFKINLKVLTQSRQDTTIVLNLKYTPQRNQ